MKKRCDILTYVYKQHKTDKDGTVIPTTLYSALNDTRGFDWDRAVWPGSDTLQNNVIIPSYFDSKPKLKKSWWKNGVKDTKVDCGLASVRKSSEYSRDWTPEIGVGMVYFGDDMDDND